MLGQQHLSDKIFIGARVSLGLSTDPKCRMRIITNNSNSNIIIMIMKQQRHTLILTTGSSLCHEQRSFPPS